MSETATAKLERKIDGIYATVGKIETTVSSLSTMMEEREKMDKLTKESLECKILECKQRISALESNQSWVVKSIIGIVITAVIGIIFVVK